MEGLEERGPDRADLAALRLGAADAAYEAHDYGGREIEGQDGWAWVEPGTEMGRVVYLAADGRSERTSFTVRFASESSAEMVETWALDSRGDFGGMPATARGDGA